MKKQTANRGGALLLSMLVIVVVAGIVAASQILSSSQMILTARNGDLDAMQTTAEGLVDYAFAAWRDGMRAKGGPLNTDDATALIAGGKRPALPPWMQYDDDDSQHPGFTITALDAAGVPLAGAAAPVGAATLSQNPKGWQATTYTYLAEVRLKAPGLNYRRKIGARGILRHDLVPPVNGLFYTEGDFELYKPAPMIIGGNVHTNANGYVTTAATTTADKLRFLNSSNISFVGSYQHAPAPHSTEWSSSNGTTDVQPPIYDRGYANQVSKAEKVEGIGTGTASVYDTTDSNQNNDSNRELIERPVSGQDDPPGIANSRIYNNAGLVIDIAGPITGTITAAQTSPGVFSGNNVTITAKNGTTLSATQAKAIIQTLSSAQTVTSTHQEQVYDPVKKKYVWKTVTDTTTVQNTMYDKREKVPVTVTDMNLGALNSTLNSLSGFNNIVYIGNTAADGPSAVRITNAGVLPTDGLTVGTDGGLYVLGDYNTGTTTDPSVVPSNQSNTDGSAQTYKTGYETKPAALVADAVMFLSNNWSNDNASDPIGSRTATNTTINSAVIAGYVPSGWTNPASNDTYWYSGGANNFPRFLENWGNKLMNFNGAFVQLFKSQMFVGEWNTGDIYSPPTRRWKFDDLILGRVIPGIPAAAAFSRGQIRPL